jgi:hypothetical protein
LKKLIKYSLTAILLVLFATTASRAENKISNAVAKDTSSIKYEKTQQFSLDKYQQDEAYNYNRETESINYWQKFWQRLFKKMNMANFKMPEVFGSNYFWYTLFTALVIFIAVKLFKTEISSFFYKSRPAAIQIKGMEEDIHTLDFESLIQKAVGEGNFKYAIRLYYLKALNELNKKELIKWEPDKTNRDYYYELSGKNMQQPFAGITLLFNWMWYGSESIDAGTFQSSKKKFTEFLEALSAGRK